ncbi:selenoprotein [Salix suchowensis]|nr:selenoprotein [Salix suchowensis]
MAPRKKAEETKTTSSEKPATRRSARMTRSTAKRLNAKLTELQAESGKKRMQEKAAESKKKKVKTEVKEAAAAKTTSSSEAQEEGNTEEVKEEEPEAEEESPTGDAVSKTIVIEHCKQCNAFKTRAIQVQDGLLSAFPGISVLLNPEKPRRGCFEIREEGGETFISLQSMKRPFPPLKALDMDKVISDIIDRVKRSTNASG